MSNFLSEQTMAQEQATYDTWKEGGVGKTALQAGASALVAGLGGGNATQAALGTAASQLAAPLTRQAGELVANVVSDQLGVTDPSTKTTLQNIVGDLTTNVASGTIGAAVGGNSGAFGASNMDRFNRQLHDTEKQRITDLANGNMELETRLQAAACALVKCSAEYPIDSEAFRYYSALEERGNRPEFDDEKAYLKEPIYLGENLFEYTEWNEYKDGFDRFNGTYLFTPRAIGTLQTVGGVAGAISGGSLALGGAATCATGVGCLAIPAGMAVWSYSVDQLIGGVQTVWNGEPQGTLGGQLITDMFGTSPEKAELIYGLVGLVGLVPAAIKGIPPLIADTGRTVAAFDEVVLLPRIGEQTVSPWVDDVARVGDNVGESSVAAERTSAVSVSGTKLGVEVDDATTSTLVLDTGARSSTNAALLRSQLTAREIADGHAFEKHVLQQGEFKGLGIRTRDQFASHIENVINNPSSVRYYKDGRTVFIQENTGTVVIRNPVNGEGTAFQPKDWNEYILRLPTRTSPY